MSGPINLPLKKADDFVFFLKKSILVCCWHDTKRLTMISTFHFVKELRSKNSETGYREILKPTCVESYNKYMGEVDIAAERCKTYKFPHRSKKWYPRMVDCLLSIVLVNSHIILHLLTETKKRH